MNASALDPSGSSLFLRLASPIDWDRALRKLQSDLSERRPASVLLPRLAEGDKEMARRAVGLIQRHDVAALVTDDPEAAIALSADGLHVAFENDLSKLRRLLPGPVALGVECPIERHAAMLAGEAGADYLAFAITRANYEVALDFLNWWRDVMIIPSVALCAEPGLDVERLAGVADFISPP